MSDTSLHLLKFPITSFLCNIANLFKSVAMFYLPYVFRSKFNGFCCLSATFTLYTELYILQYNCIIIYISLMIYISGIVPFQHFFQMLSILGFIQTGFGSPLGSAVYERILQYIQPDDAQLLSDSLDAVNSVAAHIPISQLYAELTERIVSQRQKEVWMDLYCRNLLPNKLISYKSLVPVILKHAKLPRIRRMKGIMKSEVKHKVLPIPLSLITIEAGISCPKASKKSYQA